MHLDSTKIELIRNYFKTKPVLRAYLFGSFSRDEADNFSDIDILVDLDYTQKIGLEFIQMKLDLEELLKTKIDLVSSKGISQYILSIIDQEKKMIYVR